MRKLIITETKIQIKTKTTLGYNVEPWALGVIISYFTKLVNMKYLVYAALSS